MRSAFSWIWSKMSNKAQLKTALIGPIVLALAMWLFVPWHEVGNVLKTIVIVFQWTVCTIATVFVVLGSLHWWQTTRVARIQREQEPDSMIIERHNLVERWKRRHRQEEGGDAE